MSFTTTSSKVIFILYHGKNAAFNIFYFLGEYGSIQYDMTEKQPNMVEKAFLTKMS